MKIIPALLASLGAGLVAAACLAFQAGAAGDLVAFPEGFERGVKYATVERGNLKEDIFTSAATIEAVKNGKPMPSGSVITLVDYRDGKLFRYVVMEKRAGWGSQCPPEKRNGEWEFQAFNADRSVNREENLDRCFACHRGQARNDHVYTLDRMRNAP
jgi:hypothetical protein